VATPLPEQKASSNPAVGGIATGGARPAGSTTIWIVPHWNRVPQTEHSALKVISTRSGAGVANASVFWAPAALDRSTGAGAAPNSWKPTLDENARTSALATGTCDPRQAIAVRPVKHIWRAREMDRTLCALRGISGLHWMYANELAPARYQSPNFGILSVAILTTRNSFDRRQGEFRFAWTLGGWPRPGRTPTHPTRVRMLGDDGCWILLPVA